MGDDFVHLHVHSEYSLLDGMSRLQDLVQRAVELGQPAVALTDHGVMFGAVEFYQQAHRAGVRPIIGMEAYLAPRSRFDRDAKLDRSAFHLLLLAKDERGYKNLLKLASIAQLEGFYYNPRLDKETLEKHAAGLICTTGCPSAEIPRLLRDGRQESAREALDWYRQVFGPENVFVELQDHDIPDMASVNRGLLSLAVEMRSPVLATNDVHYVRAEDAAVQDILLCIQTNSVVQDPNRMRMNGGSFYLKSRQEMERLSLFREHPEALDNTVRVAELCDLTLDFEGYRLPNFDVPEGYTAESYLRHLCEEGVRWRYRDVTSEVRQRLDMELDIIHQMGFDTYFLIVWDLCRAARERNIWWNVRGSAAGSVALYTLGITMLDPLSHHLIFERFLNPGRVTMPDIDLDYPDDQRDEMIRYMVEKYGRENVAQIITFGTLGAKAAIRDVGRAMDLPLPEVDRLAKMIPGGPGVSLADSLEKIPELQQAYAENDYVRDLIDTAQKLEGISRHASTHAAGVVVTDRPLVEYTPLHRPTKGANSDNDETQIAVTQFPMEIVESIGLLKMDFLGLSTLTIMRRTCELIARHHGIHLDLNTIPVDDAQAFALLTSGEVTGVFQVESAGMRRVLTTMKPSEFDHIVATISLYRPGPMEYIDTYIHRMHGEEKVDYVHPLLKPILEETYGIFVYQEQIIKMATDLAGYTASNADLMRRAIGKKKRAELLRHRKAFIKGAAEHSGIEQQVAGAIFDDIEFFARYGFPKGHAADYAILTCQTAYLKAHYPVEFMTALMTSERGNTEKIGVLVAECRKMGIEVLPPSVNQSGYDFTIEDWRSPDTEERSGSPTVPLWQGLTEGKAIRFGLGAVKNVGEGPIGVVMAARDDGPFQTLEEFCRRVDLRQVNRRALECLIKVGALDIFGERSQLLATIDRMMAFSSQAHKDREVGQLLIFDLDALEDDENHGLDRLPDVEPAGKRDRLAWEKELVGTYISSHPLQEHIAQLQEVVTAYSAQVGEEMDEQRVTMAGVITSVRQIYTKKNDPMAFVLLEDLQGNIEVVVFPRVYSEVKDLLVQDQLVLVRGKVDAKGREPKVLADEISRDFSVARPVDDRNGNGRKSNGSEHREGMEAEGPSSRRERASQIPARETAASTEGGTAEEPAWLSEAPPPIVDSDTLARVPVPPLTMGLVQRAATTTPKAAVAARPIKQLHITVSATGEAEQLQTVLKRVYDTLTDYVGHDRFSIAVQCGEQKYLVEFPNSRTGYCDDLESRLVQLLGSRCLSVQEGWIT